MNTSEIHRSLQAFVFRPGEVTTSWEVLERLKALAKDDPRRIDMRAFLYTLGECSPKAFDWPECGTVGCLSGWVSILLRHKEHDHRSVEEALGLTFSTGSHELFYPSWYHSATQYNTRTIQQVLDHITQFQAKYEQQLRSHRVEVSR